MADGKTISMSELLKMAASGASIKTEERPQIIAHIEKAEPKDTVTTIAKFDELLTKLDGLLKAGEARAEADLAGTRVQLEVIATLQKLIKSNNTPPNHAPILAEVRNAISGLNIQQPAPAPKASRPTAYEFDVKRTQGGYIDSIVATPKSIN